ncbi:hypothetical protein HNQ91_002791 [Filimonas zeae]|uniref:histidine kinase n=1 Tax=Filimonas zeae TaxID=1737353 RepID=A0A917J0G2_9BACT|nr:response regulator [Filimonas zeae]MDR6339726.1 hypothetical protein [Filimonas zeae]GGH69351.1 two-component system sensor histidine kinase/response regulator [Filimonas zeae]
MEKKAKEMKSAFKRNMLIGFGISLLLLIVSAIASYNSIQGLITSTRWVTHTQKVIENLEKSISYLKDAETSQRGFLLTGKASFLSPYNGAYDSATACVRRVKTLTTDNRQQQVNCEQLLDIVNNRMSQLRILIDKKKDGQAIEMDDLEAGKRNMDAARALVDVMITQEQVLLAERTGSMTKFAEYTPNIILIATALAFLITIISLIRVNSDFEKRSLLQLALEAKDADITRRINLISDIANKIAEGEYGTRAADEGRDGLGELAFSVNRMAASLENSFTALSDKEWLQTGIATLNDKMLGEYNLQLLAYNVTEFIAHYTHSQVGAFYLKETDKMLRYINGYAFRVTKEREMVALGDGITGQCAASGIEIRLKDIPVNQLTISYAAGEIKPVDVVAFPVVFERQVVGVIELASLQTYTENDLAFIRAVSHNIGVIINSIENRKKLQELLEETQSQAEELQAQHSELENINAELEIQTQKLQASEEELKVQQEELKEANTELEERTRLLEEKNNLIFERNIEIQRKAEQLALSTKYKSEFLANMSHELRTPLNSILLLSRLMSENNDKNLTREQIEYANVILSSGHGLLSLIDEILDLSKIEAGKMELEYSNVQVNDVAADMKALFNPLAREKGVEFEVRVHEEVPAAFETDKMRLEQILKNLLSNALKFTARGYVRMDVNVAAGNSAMLAFTVKDTGIGISKDKQLLIFEAFQQADGSTRRKYGGTGLGLSISRELVKLLGGNITLESTVNEGSEFTVYIPANKVAAENALAASDKEELIKTTPAPEEVPAEDAEARAAQRAERYISDVIPDNIPDDRSTVQPGDNCILIVEDDVNFARSLLDYTHKKGYKGIVSVRGDEVMELASMYQPAGILLDIQLPVKDGWEVMEMLKASPLTRHIPVHIMSSLEFRYQSLSKGAVDFINKPVAYEQMQDIFKKIEQVLTANPRKVLIVEENTRHAKALAYFLETHEVNAEITDNVNDSVQALNQQQVNCVILDMGVPDQNAYDTLEEVKKRPGLENLPIIIFTGKSLSRAEELRIKKYADSIVIKTAHSYKRILDEVSLFLHLVEEKKESVEQNRQYRNLGQLQDVLKGKKVLIADDDVRNIYSLTKALEAFHMNVISAMDGREALRQLEIHPDTDIVLMDMMMPEMDGYESTRLIREKQAFRNLPVIAVTAKAMTGDRAKCISAGASDYITKPVDIDQLLSLLRVWLYDRN